MSEYAKVMSHFLTKFLFFCFGGNNKFVLRNLEEDSNQNLIQSIKKGQAC